MILTVDTEKFLADLKTDGFSPAERARIIGYLYRAQARSTK
jgi:hypothetical protein